MNTSCPPRYTYSLNGRESVAFGVTGLESFAEDREEARRLFDGAARLARFTLPQVGSSESKSQTSSSPQKSRAKRYHRKRRMRARPLARPSDSRFARRFPSKAALSSAHRLPRRSKEIYINVRNVFKRHLRCRQALSSNL